MTHAEISREKQTARSRFVRFQKTKAILFKDESRIIVEMFPLPSPPYE